MAYLNYYIINTSIISLLFLLFFFILKKNPNTKFLLITASIFLIYCLNPYWLFGESSSIGWYDEVDLVIPNYLLLSKQESLNNNFYPEIAGGSKIINTFYLSKLNYFFLYELLQIFPDYLSFLIYRFTSILLNFSGFYFLSKEVLKIKKIEFSKYYELIFLTGLLSIFCLPIEYGWSISGLNFMYPSLLWASILYLRYNNLIFYPIILIIFSLAASTLGTNLIYFFPSILLFLILINLISYRELRIKKIIYSILPIYVTMLVLNFDVLSNLTSFDSRFLEDGSFVNFNDTITFQPISNFEKFKNEIWTTILFFARGLLIFKNTYIHTGNLFPPLLFYNIYLLFFFFLYSLKKKDFHYFNIFIFSVLIITFTNISKHFLIEPLDMFSDYSFSVLLVLIYPTYFIMLLIVFINFLDNSKSRSIFNYSLIPIFIILIFSISWMNLRSFNSMKNYGGWDIYSNNQINQFFKHEEKNNFRTISINNNPKVSILSAKGIHTYDGLRFNHTKEKSFFNSISLKNNPSKIYKPERQQFNDINNLNFKMLAMVNVKYILSEKFFENKDLIFQKKIQIKEKYFKKDYYIYKNRFKNWGLIFVPKKIINKFSKNNEIKYYVQLKNLNFQEVFDSEKNSIGDLKILNYDYNIQNNQYEITTNSKSGYLILNHVFKSKMISAYCRNKLLTDTNFVNGIMTRIIIPKNCNRVIVKFSKNN